MSISILILLKLFVLFDYVLIVLLLNYLSLSVISLHQFEFNMDLLQFLDRAGVVVTKLSIRLAKFVDLLVLVKKLMFNSYTVFFLGAMEMTVGTWVFLERIS